MGHINEIFINLHEVIQSNGQYSKLRNFWIAADIATSANSLLVISLPFAD